MNPDAPSLSNETTAASAPALVTPVSAVLAAAASAAARSDSSKATVIGRSSSQLELEPMDPQIKNIQPGGGVVIRLELAWGRLRRGT